MPKLFAVTGGAGFIGSNIAEKLLMDGKTVRIIDNLSTGRMTNIDYLRSLGKPFEFHEISIRDTDALRNTLAGVDTVFHQAALPSVPLSIDDPMATHDDCVTGTLSVLIAARDAGVRRVVYAASSAAYGDVEAEYKVESLAPKPLSPYGAAKLAGEYYCQVFNTSYDLETVVLRYFNVFGKHQNPNSQYAAVIPKFIQAMQRGEQPTIYGDGTQSRDFTHVDNVVYGNLLAAEAPNAPGHVINLATGGNVTLLQLVNYLNDLLGTQISPKHAPPRPGDIKHSRADINLATELLDYAPRVDFRSGLEKTIRWYADRSEKL